MQRDDMKDDAIKKDGTSCELSDEELDSVAGSGCDDNYNEKRQKRTTVYA